EPFFANLKHIVNLGKIRFAYGVQGNDRVQDVSGNLMNFGYMGMYESRTTMPIGNTLTLGFWQPNVANEILTWESVLKRDIGVDFSLLNNRLNVTADYYINQTRNILIAIPVPDVLGAAFPPQNVGNVENRGWELQASWRSTVNDLSYGVTGNIADVRNKVTGYGGAPPQIEDRIRRLG